MIFIRKRSVTLHLSFNSLPTTQFMNIYIHTHIYHKSKNQKTRNNIIYVEINIRKTQH